MKALLSKGKIVAAGSDNYIVEDGGTKAMNGDVVECIYPMFNTRNAKEIEIDITGVTIPIVGSLYDEATGAFTADPLATRTEYDALVDQVHQLTELVNTLQNQLNNN